MSLPLFKSRLKKHISNTVSLRLTRCQVINLFIMKCDVSSTYPSFHLQVEIIELYSKNFELLLLRVRIFKDFEKEKIKQIC